MAEHVRHMTGLGRYASETKMFIDHLAKFGS